MLRTQQHLTIHTEAVMLCAAFILQQVVLASAVSACSEPSCEASATSTAALVQRDHNRWRYHHPDLEDASSMLTCDGRQKHNCADHPLCAWSRNFSRCQARIAWFHIMKCGSTFGATLAHFANASLPKMAHMPSCRGNVADATEDTCSGNSTQGPRDFFIYKYPISEWFPEVFWTTKNSTDPGGHRAILEDDDATWKGRFVGLFRDPKARVASAYNHFVASSPDFATRFIQTNNSVEWLKTYSNLARGTVTKMMSGMYGWNPIKCEFHFDDWVSQDEHHKCEDENCTMCIDESPSEKAMHVALKRLQHFAFVGLTDYYELSVCLFHRMFGGKCHPVEFANMRKSIFHANYSEVLEEHGYDDPYDGKIFKHASKIFWSNVAKYNVTTETCHEICPNSNATFSMDSI